MKTIVPYTKEVPFSGKIHEIVSISLENEVRVESGGLYGDFIVSGEYRSHEISVNKDAFVHRLPFSIDIGDDVDLDNVDFEILDFTYEVVNGDTLKVTVEFSVETIKLEKEIEEERCEEESIFESVLETPEIIDLLEEVMEEDTPNSAQRMEDDTKDAILKNIMVENDEHVTYHIHIVKEAETLQTIAEHYETSEDSLKQYNNVEEILVGDKLLIPDESEK